MFETTPRTTTSIRQARVQTQSQQPRRLMMALGLLLVALVVLLVKDRQFWFGAEQATIESDLPETQPTPQIVKHAASRTAQTAVAKKQAHPAVVPVESASAEVPPVSVTRTILPPLDVEVVAGAKHKVLHPGTSAQHVEIPNQKPQIAEEAPETNAAQREAIPAATPQVSASASYPLLAQHMNVQGSVILQAVISPDGIVENLRVLSGPAILTTAAQQAVREWRFKPVMQNGQAVETKAKITVNFSIKVADNSADMTIAESRASDILVVSR